VYRRLLAFRRYLGQARQAAVLYCRAVPKLQTVHSLQRYSSTLANAGSAIERRTT